MAITPLSRTAELPMSSRAHNALLAENILLVGDLTQRTRVELLQINMAGPKTVSEIEAVLANHGLALGQLNPAWPPSNIEAAIAA